MPRDPVLNPMMGLGRCVFLGPQMFTPARPAASEPCEVPRFMDGK